MVKKNAGKKKEWADFCISLESAVQSQEKELVKAVHDKGESSAWVLILSTYKLTRTSG